MGLLSYYARMICAGQVPHPAGRPRSHENPLTRADYQSNQLRESAELISSAITLTQI